MKYFTILITLILIISGCRTALQPAAESAQIPAGSENPVKTVISYQVEPSKFYHDEYGYTGADYSTREEQWNRLKNILDKKGAAHDEYGKAKTSIPEYGIITIHIGRQDLMHANTRWFHFSAKNNSKVLFSYKGQEGIPNIKGKDGNWWNIIELPLPEEITSKIDVMITDIKTGRNYPFTVKRLESFQ